MVNEERVGIVTEGEEEIVPILDVGDYVMIMHLHSVNCEYPHLLNLLLKVNGTQFTPLLLQESLQNSLFDLLASLVLFLIDRNTEYGLRIAISAYFDLREIGEEQVTFFT